MYVVKPLKRFVLVQIMKKKIADDLYSIVGTVQMIKSVKLKLTCHGKYKWIQKSLLENFTLEVTKGTGV
jgi:hypothetical protein